jgi:hypothetical protein
MMVLSDSLPMSSIRAAVVLCSILAGAVSTTGCASVVYRAPDFRGSVTQQIAITSEPAGAIVRVNGVVVGATPTTITVRRKNAAEILAFEKKGYQRLERSLNRRPSAAVWGNLGLGALALNPLNSPNGLSDNPWSRSQQVAFALILTAIGAGGDVLSGAAYEAPPRLHVVLKEIPLSAGPADTGLQSSGAAETPRLKRNRERPRN